MEQILDAMEYSVYAYDVEHIILDNLQFMMGASYKGYERFDAQERALHEFRKFATAQNVHVTLHAKSQKSRPSTLAVCLEQQRRRRRQTTC